MRLVAALLGCLAAAAAVLTVAPRATAVATLDGRVEASTGPLAGKLPASVVAIGLVPAGEQAAARPARNRRYQLRVSPGIYGVVTTTWKGQRAVTRARIVRARAGKRTAVPAIRREAATAARVAIGRVQGPGGVDLSSLILGDLVKQADNAPCDFDVVVDQSDPAYQEILKELRLQTTPNFPDATRRSALKALNAQAALKPQYRVEANITQVGDLFSGPSSGTFRLVQAATGKVLYEERISFNDAGSTMFFQAAANALTRAICDIPAAFTGTGQAVITVAESGQRWEWNGTLAFVLSSGGEQKDGTFRVIYDLEKVEVSSSRYTSPPSGDCGETVATWSGSPPVKGGSLVLTVHPDLSRTYTLNIGVVGDMTTSTVTCKKGTVTLPFQMALGLVSDAPEEWLGPTIAGSYTGPWVNALMPVPGAAPFALTGSWVLEPVELGRR
jgi:hypothetical protein